MATIVVRGVNIEEWKRFKAAAIRKGLTLGQAITLATSTWRVSAQKTGKSFFQGAHLPHRTGMERLSAEVDEILYA